MENKMTYVMALDNALALVTDEATREKLEALKVQLAKKKSYKSNKPSKRQEENEKVLVPAIKAFLATVDKATASQIANGVAVDFEVTAPRVTAQLTKLKKAGEVVNTKEKGVSYYSMAE